ncbi:hypothetical protein J6590_049211, partial [Homalodisca vitripennis]
MVTACSMEPGCSHLSIPNLGPKYVDLRPWSRYAAWSPGVRTYLYPTLGLSMLTLGRGRGMQHGARVFAPNLFTNVNVPVFPYVRTMRCGRQG